MARPHTGAPKEKGLEPKEKVAFPLCPEALMPAKHMVYREGNTWRQCVLWGKQVTSVSRESAGGRTRATSRI